MPFGEFDRDRTVDGRRSRLRAGTSPNGCSRPHHAGPIPSPAPPATATLASAPTATVASAAQSPTPVETSEVHTFDLVPGESTASYTVDEEFFSGAVSRLGKQLGWFTTVGVTDLMTGTLVLERGADGEITLASGEFAVNVRALTSDDGLRDERIQREWLLSNVYPEARFTATALEGFPAAYVAGEAAQFSLVGDLSLHTMTRTVTFSTTAALVDGTLTGIATTPILMTDFGFDPPEIRGFMKVVNEALITLNFVLRERTP